LAIRNLNNAKRARWDAIPSGDDANGGPSPVPRIRPNMETPMKLLNTLTVIAIAAAGPALAEGKCTNAATSKWQPKSALQSRLEADGFKVRQIKVEGGCYEVYATDKEGKRANMAYNAETLEKLDNAEAGEN
jgi:hypothetical protein